MRKRAELVGCQNQRDPLASNPLGILLLNGHLSEDQVHAAWRFAILRWRLYGKPFPAAAKVYDPFRPNRGSEPAADPVGEDRYAKCCEVLKDCGLLAWQEVRSTAMEQRLPAWFLRLKMGEMRDGDGRRQEALRLGLDALVREFGISSNSRSVNERPAKIA
ncbi:MAG: hypothetical protein ACTSX7_08210 [Alphaproteobacteria bacterium]